LYVFQQGVNQMSILSQLLKVTYK